VECAGCGLGVAAAAAAVGAFLGFLFGIPTGLQEKALGLDEPYGPNTNLEQISDWLTKILVGVGLVELGRAGPAVGKLIASVGGALGNTGAARVTAAALLVVFVVWGSSCHICSLGSGQLAHSLPPSLTWLHNRLRHRSSRASTSKPPMMRLR
jgi:hypothetical protein